jgi:hypothetical protein
MHGAVPPLPTRLVAWYLIEHLANFQFINTSATSTTLTAVATNTNTNIGVAAVAKVMSVHFGISNEYCIAISPLVYILPRIV